MNKVKKAFAMICVICMVLTMLPGMTMKAYAATKYANTIEEFEALLKTDCAVIEFEGLLQIDDGKKHTFDFRNKTINCKYCMICGDGWQDVTFIGGTTGKWNGQFRLLSYGDVVFESGTYYTDAVMGYEDSENLITAEVGNLYIKGGVFKSQYGNALKVFQYGNGGGSNVYLSGGTFIGASYDGTKDTSPICNYGWMPDGYKGCLASGYGYYPGKVQKEQLDDYDYGWITAKEVAVVKESKNKVPTVPKPSLANTNTGIKITWKKDSSIAGYVVYRKQKSESRFKAIKTTTAGSFVDTTAAKGKVYFYKIRGYRLVPKRTTKFYGNDSDYAIMKRLATPELSVTKTSTGIKASWKAVTGAKGYRVYRKRATGDSYTLIKTVTKTYYNDTTAVKGRKYNYKVRAYWGNYDSNFSAVKTITR